MHHLKYLFQNKFFYITIIISIITVLFFNAFFIKDIKDTGEAIKTFNNFDSALIGYDNGHDDHDSFKFYGDKVYAKKFKNTDDALNAQIYELIKDQEYSNKSILNQNNVYKGEYKILDANEAAVSKYVSKKYDLDIGDIIYVNRNIPCKIKYITRDFYQIYEVDFKSAQSTIFIGSNTINNDSLMECYANFDAKTLEMHNEIYFTSDAKYEINNRLSMQISLISIVTLILFLIPYLFSINFQCKAYAVLNNYGCPHLVLTSAVNELICLIIGYAFIMPILLLFGGHWIHLLSVGIAMLISSIVHFSVVNIKRRIANE